MWKVWIWYEKKPTSLLSAGRHAMANDCLRKRQLHATHLHTALGSRRNRVENCFKKVINTHIVATGRRISVRRSLIWLNRALNMLKKIIIIFITELGGKFVLINRMQNFTQKLRKKSMLLTPLEAINGFLWCPWAASTLLGSVTCHLGGCTGFKHPFLSRKHKKSSGDGFF